MNILRNIKRVLSGWGMNDIFHDGKTKWVHYDEPKDYGWPWGKQYGYSSNIYTYTKLGAWFEEASDIAQILKLLWYIPVLPIYIISNTLWFIIELFLNEETKRNLRG